MSKQFHIQWEGNTSTTAIAMYCQCNKWFLPFGLCVWNRYATNPNVYYRHLIEISIGVLCFRFVIAWWRRTNE